MIEIESLTEKDIGRWVKYWPTDERGRIKSWNSKWVFVVYKCDNEWERFQNYTGCASKPSDLTFIPKPTIER